MSIPSRRDNPFATCWTKPGAIRFRFDAGQSAEHLVARLASQYWVGAIIGPHGSGKSTLMETLKPALIARGCQIHSITLRGGQRRLPTDFLIDCQMLIEKQYHDAEQSAQADPTPQPWRLLVVVDGFEQLRWLERARLRWFCRRRNAGLLVTSHRRIGIRPLIRLSPGQKLIEQLVANLCSEVSTGVTALDVAASNARHGSNVREILFDLYDRHERLRTELGLGVSARP
jgi:energy-coupling factor transporter ATP-binding protein EcfA2